MTDEQIIKALECCATDDVEDCSKCPYENMAYTPGYGGCADWCREDAIDLINRQKAEIEKLKVELKQKNPYEEYGNCVAIGDSLVFTHTLNDYDKLIKDIGTEAIWEFAERLKNKIWYNPACNRYRTITPDDIYDLARKMMEVQE